MKPRLNIAHACGHDCQWVLLGGIWDPYRATEYLPTTACPWCGGETGLPHPPDQPFVLYELEGKPVALVIPRTKVPA